MCTPCTSATSMFHDRCILSINECTLHTVPRVCSHIVAAAQRRHASWRKGRHGQLSPMSPSVPAIWQKFRKASIIANSYRSSQPNQTRTKPKPETVWSGCAARPRRSSSAPSLSGVGATESVDLAPSVPRAGRCHVRAGAMCGPVPCAGQCHVRRA